MVRKRPKGGESDASRSEGSGAGGGRRRDPGIAIRRASAAIGSAGAGAGLHRLPGQSVLVDEAQAAHQGGYAGPQTPAAGRQRRTPRVFLESVAFCGAPDMEPAPKDYGQ